METSTRIINLIDSSLGEYVVMGGKGSGNWGHKGRPGKRGGSAPRGIAKKSPPINSTTRVDETLFTKAQVTRIKKEASVLPQDHCDAVDIVYQDYIGEGYAAQCNQYNVITMARNRRGVSQWRAGDLTHEIGHAVSNYKKKYGIIGDPSKPHRIFDRFYRDLAEGAGFDNSRALQKHYSRRGIKSKFYKGFPSRYAMSHPAELFAESYMMYVRSPKTLSKRNPDIYDYMRDNIFDGVEYTK